MASLFKVPELTEQMRSPGVGLVMRALEDADFDKGFLALLSQLTQAPPLARDRWMEICDRMRDSKCYYTVVVEDVAAKTLVATATLLVEHKFLRGGNLAGHVEDVVVDSSQRGKKLGVKLMAALLHVGRELGCYKVILDCSRDNVEFYKRCGFKEKEVQMAVYLPIRETRLARL